MSTDPTATSSKQSATLCARVRTTPILVSAWHEIRRNAETSRVKRTKQDARQFDKKLPSNIRKLQTRLRMGYKFAAAYGATPPKAGKEGKRPIVVAPLEDRIIQRAILDVLQNAAELPAVQEVLATQTSVGGVPNRGVGHAIELFEARVAAGDRYVAGSDIKGFFTKIKTSDVCDFLKRAGADDEFVDLIQRALTVELSNEAELSTEDRMMFPDRDVGVAQGCPLSALAGNIVLQQFDKEMNQRGITCIRYIDDFILIGSSLTNVEKAMHSARKKLRALNMDIYLPQEKPEKAFIGKIGEPHKFLGYLLIPNLFPPAQSSVEQLYNAIDELIRDGKKSIRKTIAERTLNSRDRCYAQTIVAIDNTIKGWLGSFRKCQCTKSFDKIDAEINRRVENFARDFTKQTASLSKQQINQALGIRGIKICKPKP